MFERFATRIESSCYLSRWLEQPSSFTGV